MISAMGKGVNGGVRGFQNKAEKKDDLENSSSGADLGEQTPGIRVMAWPCVYHSI